MAQSSQEVVATDVLSVGPPGTQATTTAALVAAANATRTKIAIANNGAAVVYIGKASTVTTSTGYPIAANGSFVDTEYTGAIYAIVASGTADLRVWEVG